MPLPGHFSATINSETYTRDGLNRYTSVASASFSYDGRSNLTSDGSRTFAYDLENRLIAVGGSASLSSAYDPLGRLLTTVSNGQTIQYLYDGDQLVGEYVNGGVARRYVHGVGVDDPLVWYEGWDLNDRRWLHANHQGSIVAVSDISGNISGSPMRYSSFGEPDTVTGWGGSRFRYTGQTTLPGVALYHYKARVYDPKIGRFLQTDPIGYEDDFYLYAYVGNDPWNKTDPTGMVPECGDNSGSYNCSHTVLSNGVYGTEPIGSIRAMPVRVPNAPSSVAPAVKPPSTLKPGPYAGNSIPARGTGRNFTRREREQTNETMSETGCHTCGSKDPGTVSGNAVPDHQPPSGIADGASQRLYPHCLKCSGRQMREVRQEQVRRRREEQARREEEARRRRRNQENQ